MKRAFLLMAAVGLLFVAGCGDEDHGFFTVENAIINSHSGFVQALTICGVFGGSSVEDAVAATPQCGGVATGGLVAVSTQPVAGAPGSELVGADQNGTTNRGIANTVVLDANQASNAIDIFFVQPSGTLVPPTAGTPVPSGIAGANALAITPNTIGTLFVYVAGPSGAGASAINGFALDTSAGTLTPLGGAFPVAVGGAGTQALVIDRTGAFLFAINNGTNNISRFGINPATGALTALGAPTPLGPPAAADVVSATTDPANRFLFIADDAGASRIRVFAIGAGGALAPVAGQPFPVAGGNAEDLVVDGTSSFLYVAEEGSIQTFGIGAGGALASLGLTVPPPGPTGAPTIEGLAIDSSNTFLIATDDGNAGVDSFSGAGTGALAAVAGSPFPTGTAVANENPNRVTTATFTTAVP